MRRIAPWPVQSLHRRHDTYTRHLDELLASTGAANVINPSMGRFGSAVHVAYRALPDDGPPFRAHLLVDRDDGSRQIVDLSAHAAAFGVEVVADPKLVELAGRLHVTFNSGYDPVRNELYLMEVAPRLGPPLRCEYAGRGAVEKNWGFFESGGRLQVLYSLRPLVVLRRTEPGLDAPSGALCFEAAGPVVDATTRRPVDLTIGTQPVLWNGRLLLMAHEKVHLRRRRGYLGRAVSVLDPFGAAASVRVSPVRFVHSLASVVRQPRTRHNPHLLFATYFSGLQLDGDHAYLGYGINDVDRSFARVEAGPTWR